MSKTITLFLTTGHYAGENTDTTIRIAETALEKGHRVNVIA
jgi:sulfur relay (sulfurtransferase) complex TusBCD TusD component (DsrE family)